ncbi:MAG: hypothetical protein IVW36_02160 [Dehalococcoidia bacterium]|nr:hypothetical protein [Dehalococcoidia bacterium]
MMVRLDFGGRASTAARALRVRPRREPGVAIIAECGPRLPFKDGSIDELFVDRAIAARDDIAATLDELWRVSRPGALIHLRLPHASSVLAVTRDPRARPMFTLGTFNYYDPNFRRRDAPLATTFSVERARLHLAGARGDDSGLALARGPLARFIEKLANGSRGSQYRFERWFAALFGGFEEFSVVLAAVKPQVRPSATMGRVRPAGAADPSTLHVTSDIAHEAANVEPAPDDLAPELPPSEGPTGSSLPQRPFVSGTSGGGTDA